MTDIIFIGNAYSDKRRELADFLKSLPYDVQIWGNGYAPGVSCGQSLYDFKKTGELIRSAKIVIGDNQFDAEGFLSDRFFNSLAAGGALLLHQDVARLEELTGFAADEHYISWRDHTELEDMIKYYLSHEEERREIAACGTEYCLTRHSFDNRVEELEGFISELPVNKERTLSTSIICKNEYENIQRIVNLAAEFSDEVVVVDTGSVDGTRSLLTGLEEQKRCKVFDFKWTDDFSEARNYARDKCSSSWILWLDCDDELPQKTVSVLKEFKNWDFTSKGVNFPSVFRFVLVDYRLEDGKKMPYGSCFQYRLFRNVPSIFWRGRIHEGVDKSVLESGQKVGDLQYMEIHHKGNLKKSKNKASRNMSLIRAQANGVWKFYSLGLHHYTNFNYESAAYWFQKALDVNEGKESRQYLLFCCGLCHYELGFYKDAMKYLSLTDFSDAKFLKGIITNNPQLLSDYIEDPLPTEFMSYKKRWEPTARELITRWIKREEKLNHRKVA